MKKTMLVLIVVVLSSTTSFADKVVKKNLGDINGDGVKEIVIEEWSTGSSGDSAIIKIFSSKKLVFGPVGLSGGTADGYKIVKKQIVVWQGNWNNASKWDPHVYDFRWYNWDKKTRKFIVAKEGFTRITYSYKQAVKIMPMIAIRLSKSIILSKKATFLEDACVVVVQKYKRDWKLGHEIGDGFGEDESSDPLDSKVKQYIKRFYVILRRRNTLRWEPETGNPNRMTVQVVLLPNGRYLIENP